MPIQFPFGTGGPNLKRRTKISDEVLLRHYLRLSLSQFMRSEFVLLANHMLNRVLSYKSALLKCRPMINDNGTTMGVEISKMTVEDVKEAIKEEHDTVAKMDDTHVSQSKGKNIAKKFLQAVRALCRAMGHTKYTAEYARRKCFALQEFFGLHALFSTITPDDECNFRISLYVTAGTKASTPMSQYTFQKIGWVQNSHLTLSTRFTHACTRAETLNWV